MSSGIFDFNVHAYIGNRQRYSFDLLSSPTSSWVALATIVVCFATYVNYSFNYWKRRGVHSLPPRFPCGSITDVICNRRHIADVFGQIYGVMKSRGKKYAGAYFFLRPVFVLIDWRQVKSIMQTNFLHFSNRGFYVNESIDPLTGNLFSQLHDRWRFLRTMLTPTFTSSKMRMMFHTLVNSTEGLKEVIDEHIEKQVSMDVKDVLARFNTDVIGSCAFGIECNSLRNPDAVFRIYGDKILEPRLSGLIELAFSPRFMQAAGLRTTPRDVEKFFLGLIAETVKYREAHHVHCNDFLDLLMQLKNRGYVADDAKPKDQEANRTGRERITMNELAAQCFVFFVAGYETSSTTSTFALYELALNQDIQDKAKAEINVVLEKHGNQITYEAIMDMPFLDKIVYEALRKYPPLPVLHRACTKDYQIPETSIVVEKNTMVIIPIMAIQRDPEYYPEPEAFKPERFDDENKQSRPPYTWLSFGDGPRVCIGFRFGMLQVKVALATILKNYRVTCSDKMKAPIKLVPTDYFLTAQGGIWLNLERVA